MPQVPRVTAQKRTFSALLPAIYERHVADGYVTPTEKHEMLNLLRLNAHGDALIDAKDAATVNHIRSPFGETLTERLITLAAWEPAWLEIQEILKHAKTMNGSG